MNLPNLPPTPYHHPPNMIMPSQPQYHHHHYYHEMPPMGMNMSIPGFGISLQTNMCQVPPPMGNALAQQIIAALRNSSFKGEMYNAVQTYSSSLHCPVSGSDLCTILGFFDFDNDKFNTIIQLKQTNNIAQMSAYEASNIMRLFDFDNSRLNALQLLVTFIYDRRVAAETVVGTFDFDPTRARNILLTQ